MAAMMKTEKKSGQFLVYDLGGGTFDLALVQALNGEISVLDHEGINMLGGRDFDKAIVNAIVRPWLLEHFDLPDDLQKHPRYRARHPDCAARSRESENRHFDQG